MKIGINLPQAGRLADPLSIRATAIAAERAGYASLWVLDRILGADQPRTPYPGCSDGVMPPELATILDPIGALTLAAAVTERVRVGTSVLVAPWYPPVLLTRALTTLDRISSGRLTVGLGIGWSLDEYEAVSIEMSERRPSRRDPRCVRRDLEPPARGVRRSHRAHCTVHDPAETGSGRRTTGVARGVHACCDAAGRPTSRRMESSRLPGLRTAPTWHHIRDLTASHGRDPNRLQLVVRANIRLTDRPIDGSGRESYCGSLEQVAEDIAATAAVGADELVLGLIHDPTTIDELLAVYDSIARAADLPVAPLAGILA